RTKDGKPLVLTWDQLADMAKKQPGFRMPAAAQVPGADFTSAFGPRPTEANIAQLEREGAKATAQRETQIKSTAGALAAGRARHEGVMTPGTPEREAAMQRARERNQADALAALDREERAIRTRPGRRQESLDRELARIAAERLRLKGGP